MTGQGFFWEPTTPVTLTMREEKERREEYPWPVESRACSGKSFENPSI
jgi:hypothetical protein